MAVFVSWEAQWTSVTCSPTKVSFSYELTGLEKDKEYYYRAWARKDSKTVYGKEVNFLTTDKLILTPTVADFSGFPSAQAYANTEADATKSGTYTYRKDNKDYEFYFYGKKQLYSSKYNLYYGAGSGQNILFGASGSYVLLPAVEGKKLVTVTISIYKATKSWSITTKEGVGEANTSGAPSGGESHSFTADGDKYTFNLSGTENNTSYALRSGNSNSGIKIIEIIYQ